MNITALPCEQSSFESLPINHSSFFIYFLYNEINYLFGGENMEYLADIGILFGGLGLLLLSFSLLMYTKNLMRQNKRRRNN